MREHLTNLRSCSTKLYLTMSDTTQLLTSNFIGPWYHAALLFSGLGSTVLLFSQQIREDLARAAYCPNNVGW